MGVFLSKRSFSLNINTNPKDIEPHGVELEPVVSFIPLTKYTYVEGKNIQPLKITLLGDTCTGKTMFLMYLLQRYYNTTPTIGVDFAGMTYSINEIDIRLQFWDTCGQERFQRITNVYTRNTKVFFMFYKNNDMSQIINRIKYFRLCWQCLANINIVLITGKYKQEFTMIDDSEHFISETGVKPLFHFAFDFTVRENSLMMLQLVLPVIKNRCVEVPCGH